MQPVSSNNEGAASIPVSVLVFTLNEELNLPHCLASLKAFEEVIVVDSYSSDDTQAVCRKHGVRFFQHEFEGFGRQRNWALANIEITHSWVLILDADERVPAELGAEIARRIADASTEVGAFRLKRRFYMWGKWLKHSSLYPTWVIRLVHKDRVRYIDRGHAETQEVDGDVLDLQHDLIDENRKGIAEWFERQNRYTSKDALHELAELQKPLDVLDLLSHDPMARRGALKRLGYRFPARGLLYFLYSYLWRGGFLDGREGMAFCRMRALYQTMVMVKKFDLRSAERRR